MLILRHARISTIKIRLLLTTAPGFAAYASIRLTVYGGAEDIVFLYRFRPFDNPENEKSVERLRWEIVERGIYFQSPLEMNDPYDCFCRFDIGTTKEERNRTLEYLKDHAPEEKIAASHLSRHQFAQYIFDKMVEKGTDQLAQDYRAVFARRGLCCFTEDPRSILMWAHYASGHKGVCLIYEAEQGLVESGLLHRVNYCHEPPTMRLYEYEAYNGDHHEKWGKLTSRTKFSHWNYENEWRLLSKKVGPMSQEELVGLKLVGVICGSSMPVKSLEVIKGFIKERPTRRLDATRDFNRYQVNIRRLPRA